MRHGGSPRVARAAHPPASHPSLAAPPAGPRSAHVERTFAWIGRNRRLAKDFEATIASAEAFLYAASIMLLLRRIARSA